MLYYRKIRKKLKKKIKEKNKVKENKEELSQTKDGKTVLIRSSKDIKENLKLVAKNSKNIPVEHLNSFLGEILINSNENKLKEINENKEIILKNPDLNHNKQSAENLLSIYNQIYEKSDKTKIIDYNNIFDSHLKTNKRINELLTKSSVKKEDIQELTKIIGELKTQAFKNEFKKDYDKVNLVIKGPDISKSAELSGNTLVIYFNNKSDKTMKEYLGTIVHEYTHNDQRNLKKYELLSSKDNLGYLYTLNSSKNGYIEPSSSNKGYKEQPVEMEAFNAQKKIILDQQDNSDNPKERGELERQIQELGIEARKEEVINGLTKENSNNSIQKKIIIPEKGIQINSVELDNKSFTEALEIVSVKIKTLNEEQEKLKNQETNEIIGKFKLDLEFRLLKETINEYILNNKLENSKEIFNKEKEIKNLFDSINQYESNNELYFSGKKEEKKILTEELEIITRSEKDIFQNLKTIAESKKNIPTEHLLNYLNNLIKNDDFKKNQDNLTGEKKEILLKNPVITHNEESELSLSKIYNNIYSKTNSDLRDELTSNFENVFYSNDVIIKFLKDEEITSESIKKIAEEIQNLKARSFKEVLDLEYEKVEIKIQPPREGILGINTGEVLNIYLQNDLTKKEILETIIHELTHQDQNNLKYLNIEGFNDRNLLYNLNSSKGGYIQIDSDKLYRNQPIEDEAHRSETIVEFLISQMNLLTKDEK